VGCECCDPADRTGKYLASGARGSFSIYLPFIHTKTRQPVGFQLTDIAD
jgi:hypothetical protein